MGCSVNDVEIEGVKIRGREELVKELKVSG